MGRSRVLCCFAALESRFLLHWTQLLEASRLSTEEQYRAKPTMERCRRHTSK